MPRLLLYERVVYVVVAPAKNDLPEEAKKGN